MTLRELVNWKQDDWATWVPIAISAINGRDSRSTQVSPFFLSYGWNQSVLPPLDSDLDSSSLSPRERADKVVQQLAQARDFV